MYPTSRLTRPLSRVQSTPAMRARPLVGRSWPTRMRIVVVLPAPLGPTKPRIWPRPSSRDRPSRAVKSPYCLVSRSRTRTGPSPVSPAMSLLRGPPGQLEPQGGALPLVRPAAVGHADAAQDAARRVRAQALRAVELVAELTDPAAARAKRSPPAGAREDLQRPAPGADVHGHGRPVDLQRQQLGGDMEAEHRPGGPGARGHPLGF